MIKNTINVCQSNVNMKQAYIVASTNINYDVNLNQQCDIIQNTINNGSTLQTQTVNKLVDGSS